VPRSSHPADIKSYTQYENVLDVIEAYQAGLLKLKSAADLKSYTQYEDVLDRIALTADKSATQQKSLEEQLVGTWPLVSADQGQQGGYIPNPFD
jgi:hypothetical protein